MSEECIAEYKDEIESGAEYFCSNLLEDFNGDGKAAYEYAESHVTWEEIPEIIIGDPDENPAIAEMYHLVAEECQKLFQLKLLGTY
tara:strand:+ start:653 stop:910 length:258 start_codon:yes stop_codon:yes gene_type:complete